MDDLAVKVAMLTATFALGLAGVSYDSFAVYRGWPVGAWFASAESYISILAFLSMFGAPVAALLIFPWPWVFVVVIAGFFLGFMATLALKQNVQFLIVTALPIFWVSDILYVLP